MISHWMDREGPVLPRETSAAPLDVVIGVMAFLAALSLGASLVSERTAESWRSGVAGRFTVQIIPPLDGTHALDMQREVESVVALLRATPGIMEAEPLSDADERSLVAPWLGNGALAPDLPLPRLVDATLQPGVRVDLAGLTEKLKKIAPDSVVDDHTRWISRLKRLADAIVWSAYAVLGLIGIATASAVMFATRAGLAAHHEIVALLHQMGARTGFIARAFEWHYFISALVASLAGAGLAAAFFVAAGGLEQAGLEPVAFLPPLGMHPSELAWLAVVPACTALIALTTARLSVMAALRQIY